MHYLLRCDQRLCSHQPGRGTFTCCADCEIKSSAPVCAWPLCSGAVSVLSCRFWMSPAPENMGSSRISHNSGFACVIYGFMLLPGTPVLICVLSALGYVGYNPNAVISASAPQWLYSGLPTCCIQQEFLRALFPCRHQLSFLPSEPKKEGMKGAGRSPGIVPSLAW